MDIHLTSKSMGHLDVDQMHGNSRYMVHLESTSIIVILWYHCGIMICRETRYKAVVHYKYFLRSIRQVEIRKFGNSEIRNMKHCSILAR